MKPAVIGVLVLSLVSLCVYWVSRQTTSPSTTNQTLTGAGTQPDASDAPKGSTEFTPPTPERPSLEEMSHSSCSKYSDESARKGKAKELRLLYAKGASNKLGEIQGYGQVDVHLEGDDNQFLIFTGVPSSEAVLRQIADATVHSTEESWVGNRETYCNYGFDSVTWEIRSSYTDSNSPKVQIGRFIPTMKDSDIQQMIEAERKMKEEVQPPSSASAETLIWAKQDNGGDVNWDQASNYCSNLRLAGYSNWRLPTIDELAGIYDESQNVDGWHIKEGIRLSGGTWSSSAGNASGKAWVFLFVSGQRYSYVLDYSDAKRALCVRRSGE